MPHSGTLGLGSSRKLGRDIRIDAQFAAGDFEVTSDHVKLQQVLLNLAVSAMDAMQESSPENRVLMVATRPAGEGVEIIAADRGGSFQAASAQDFEPFYTTKPHGMGLGLSIVRSIVEVHHGRVSVAMRDGGGVEIVVWLPLAGNRNNTHGTELT